MENEKKIVPRLMGINEVMEYVGLSRVTAIKFANEAGARRKYGKRTLYDRQALDKHIDNMATENEGSEC